MIKINRVFRDVLIFFLIITLLLGCQSIERVNFEGKEVKKIKLTSLEVCSYKDKVPFDEKTFAKTDEIKIFIEAIESSEAMMGMLNYFPCFLMEVSFRFGGKNTYHLSVFDEEGIEGLLVNLKNTGQGYIINEEMANQLRNLIYSD